MTREEALRAMTWAPAFAAFEEREKGTLELGKLADLTVVDVDLLSAGEEDLARARVTATVVGGRVVWEAPAKTTAAAAAEEEGPAGSR